MKRKKMAEDEGTAELSCYMMKVIDDLMAGKKYPAVHTYQYAAFFYPVFRWQRCKVADAGSFYPRTFEGV